MTRACLIDVYDTILTSMFMARVRALAEPLGIAPGDWLAEWEKTREDRDRGRLTTAESIMRALPACGVEPAPGLVESLLRQDEEFSRLHTRLFDDTIPFLNWLRSRGVLIALVSNCPDTTRGQLDRLGVIPLVDAVVLSCEIGSMKPHPPMYATALEELGVAAADAVFIDDQPRFCAGAEAVGVRAIQITRDGIAPYGIAPYGAAPYGAAPYGAAPHGIAPDGTAPHGIAPDGAARQPPAAPGFPVVRSLADARPLI